jgi:hypothetical protein
MVGTTMKIMSALAVASSVFVVAENLLDLIALFSIAGRPVSSIGGSPLVTLSTTLGFMSAAMTRAPASA